MGPSQKAPASKASNSVDLGYDPQAMEMKHDSFFSEVAPGVANSGNMAHKWSVEGDHSNSEEPPSGMKGE